MLKQFYTGTVRGHGYARMIFDFKENRGAGNRHLSFLESVSNLDKFTPEMVQNAARIAGTVDRYTFWAVLFLLRSVADGGTCVDAGYVRQIYELIEGPLNKNSTVNPAIVVEDRKYFYFSKYLEYEIFIARKTSLLMEARPAVHDWVFSPEVDDERKEKIRELFARSFSFITGGPGTGKTTTIRQLLQTALNSGIEPEWIALCAPTGKAAKRIRESCADIYQATALAEPFTIHRLLGYNPARGFIRHTENNPVKYHLLIVDEASMIDLQLMYLFLKAVPLHSDLRIIFAGDRDQLLSVKAGAVFSDLISVNRNTLLLDKTWRQAAGSSGISRLARGVREGDAAIPDFKNEPGVDFIEPENDDSFLEAVLNWYNQNGKNGQILTPFNETAFGVSGLNGLIRDAAAPSGFVSGEPVIFNGNLQDVHIFNGETGILEERGGAWYLIQSEREVLLHKKHFSYMKPAYAITIHKSQGSEYEHVCIVLPEVRDELLTRRILYTGITRAKKSVTIIGYATVWNRIMNESEEGRHSLLAERLKENT